MSLMREFVEDPDNALPRKLSRRAMRTIPSRRPRSTSVSARQAQVDTTPHLCHGTTRLRKANVVGAVCQINTLSSVIDGVMATKTGTDRVLGATTIGLLAVTAHGKDKMIATARTIALVMPVGSVVMRG
jgi:hypothetical protein